MALLKLTCHPVMHIYYYWLCLSRSSCRASRRFWRSTRNFSNWGRTMSSLDRSNCEYYKSIKAIKQVKSWGLKKDSNTDKNKAFTKSIKINKAAVQLLSSFLTEPFKYIFAYFKRGKSWAKREIKGWDFGSCTQVILCNTSHIYNTNSYCISSPLKKNLVTIWAW